MIKASIFSIALAGLRTPQRQFSSCVLIEADDSLDSINATTSSIVKYVSQKAGIGIGGGRIRAIGSPIRNGDASHWRQVNYDYRKDHKERDDKIYIIWEWLLLWD